MNAAYIWMGLFALAVVTLVMMGRRVVQLTDERDDLLNRMISARLNLTPLLDDVLFRSIKDWRKKHTKEFVSSNAYVLGQGRADNADRLVRAFCWLNPTPDERRKLDILVAKMETKSGMDIRIDFER